LSFFSFRSPEEPKAFDPFSFSFFQFESVTGWMS
jgi:hypothetical protein